MLAILFDLDGTLIHSLPLFREAIHQILTTKEKALDETFFWEWHAKRLPWSDLFERHSLEGISEDEFSKECHTIFETLMNERASPTPGADNLIAALYQAEYRLGIVSNAPSEYIERSIMRFNWSKYFSIIVAGDNPDSKPKPNPDGLLLACKKLNIQPNEALYIGDQLFDVMAANSAGMPCIYLNNQLNFSEFEEKATRVNSLEEILSIIPKLTPG